MASNVPQLEEKSFGHSDQVIDDDIDIEEIKGALTMLKTNKSGGLDGLKAEHFKYGGEHLKLWLKKIFNLIPALEDTPQCMKDGLVANPNLQTAREKSFTIKQLPRNYHLSRLVQDLRNNPSAATFSNPA